MEASLLTGALLASALAWGALPVKEVVIDAPGATDVDRLAGIFGVRAGDPLSRAEIRRGVRALVASGQIEDVVVEVRPNGEGVVLAVKLQVASRTGAVRISGLSRRHQRIVKEMLDIHPGQPLLVASFEDAVERATAALRGDGFPDARLDASLDFDRAAGTVDVSLVGSVGAPLLVMSVEASKAGLDEAGLWRATGLRRGGRLSREALSQARSRLTRELRKRGLWETEVSQPRVTGSGGEAVVHLDVECGPRYRLELHGLELSRSLRESAFPFLSGGEGFSKAMLDLTIAAVRRWAQREGHYLAEVGGEVVSEGDERVLRITAVPGPRLRIGEIRFPGAEAVGDEVLRSRVAARRGRPGRWRGEPVDDESLAADAASVRATLAREGYADAEVAPPRLIGGGGSVVVEFPVTLGPRRTVRALEVVGVPDDVPVPALPLAAGGPWSATAEETARQLLTDRLRNAGYLFAEVGVEHDCSDGSCTVVVRASPGEKLVLGRLIVAGLGRTRADVVDKVLRLKPGDIVSPEVTLAAQRRLLGLGIFKQASTKGLPGLTAGRTYDLVLELSEAPTRTLGFGLGWDTDARASVSVSWSELNLLGTARSLDLDLRYSSREQRWQVSFREPAELGLLGIPTWISAFRTEETYDTYSLLRRGMWVEFGDRRRRPARVFLRYEYEITEPDAPVEILSNLEREHQSARVASVTPIVEYDSRDDAFEPHRGILASVQYQNAFPVFNADAAFHKLSCLAAGFVEVGNSVVAGSLRLGAIEPKKRVEGSPDNLLLPIAVRYFAGGRISHRSFAIDRLGIPGETLDAEGRPLGGAGLALGNLELRFPIAGAVGGALFLDTGNVWAAFRDMDAEDLRWGAGLGVRVATPIGPLRLEYGWKLDRLTGESPGELFFAFGNPF